MRVKLTATKRRYLKDNYVHMEMARQMKKLGFVFEEQENYNGRISYVIKESPGMELEKIQELRDFAIKWGELVAYEQHGEFVVEIYNERRD